MWMKMDFLKNINSESGSAVTVLMGGVAVLAMLSFGVYQLVSGPLTSMSRVTQKNQVNNHLAGIAAIAAIDAANIGDCDDDGFIEPREFRTTSGGVPTNGGLVPTDMGIDVKDPWNMDYGYCVWDLGPQYDQATCGGTGANRLDGADDSVTGEPQTLTVFAIISAGMNRSFETTCNDYSDTTTDVITAGGDDIVYRYTYNEAATATSSLWALKTGDADTAQINKNLEIGDDITFDQTTGAINALALNASDQVQSLGGIKLGDESTVTSCSAMTAGTLRYNSALVKIQYCDTGGSWVITDDINWPIEAPDGTSGAPSYSFTNSTTSGVYQQGGSVEMVSPTGTTASIKGGSSLISVNDTTVSLASNGSLDMQAPNSGEIDFSNGGTDFRLKSNGGLQIANTTGTCDANSQGTIRYAFSTVYFEYCDGSDWVELSKEKTYFYVVGGQETSCGVDTSTGKAWCWGRDVYKQLGNGDTLTSSSFIPAEVGDVGPWDTLSTGIYHICGLRQDSTIWCWGNDTYGNLGNGSVEGDKSLPYQISDAGPWKSIIKSSGYTVCAIKSDDTGYCWGRDSKGEAGNGSATSADLHDPTPISGGHSWEMIDGSYDTICGITTAGAAYCWGNNAFRQVGDGTSTQRDDPTPVAGGDTWLDISSGYHFSCGIKADQEIYCWGLANSGRLANGASSGTYPTPGVIDEPGPWKSLSLYSDSACAIKVDGSLWCWGKDSNGRLGNGSATTADQLSPVEVTEPGPWETINVNTSTCATKEDGSGWCWGGGWAVGDDYLGGAVHDPTLVASRDRTGTHTISLVNHDADENVYVLSGSDYETGTAYSAGGSLSSDPIDGAPLVAFNFNSTSETATLYFLGDMRVVLDPMTALKIDGTGYTITNMTYTSINGTYHTAMTVSVPSPTTMNFGTDYNISLY